MDDVGKKNKAHWEWAVATGAGCTVPWLDLSAAKVARFFDGDLSSVPDDIAEQLYPREAFADLEGKDVLCLATGGGQQSAVFGLLGAHVTVVDFTEGQLEGDRRAAERYNFPITCVQADMRDLTILGEGSYDLVYQGNCMAWVPDAREIYGQVGRVLRRGGRYRIDFSNPATEFIEPDTWDGEGYKLTVPYGVKSIEESPNGEDPGCFQFRHSMESIFNGLIEAGFMVHRVMDAPHLYADVSESKPGSWKHSLAYIGGFALLAVKN